jgi:hypothetical protein
MHCPRCGAEAVIGQQFCRGCGFNLEKVAELVAEQPSALSIPTLAHLHLRQRRFEHWAGIAGLAFMSLVFLSLIYLVIIELMIKSGKIGVGLLLLIFFLGGGVIAALQGYAKSLKQQLTLKNSATVEDLLKAGTINQLEPQREPISSVTDHTTELLTAQPRKRGADTKEV